MHFSTSRLGLTTVRVFRLQSQNCPQLLSCKGVSKGVSKGKAGFHRPSSLCLKHKMFARITFAPLYRFYLRRGSFWLSVLRSRKLTRLLKLLVIILSSCSIFYFASVLFTSESGENFPDEEQESTDTCKGGKGRLTISIWSDL